MKKNLAKKSILSIVLVCVTAYGATAVAEISADGRFVGQGSATATAAANGNDTQHANAASTNSAAVSGNAGARVNDDAIRGSVEQNGSAVIHAGATAVRNTVAGAQQSGNTFRQQAEQISGSVHVNGDALANGAVSIETGDGVVIDLNSVSSGNAGVTVYPVNSEQTVAVTRDEISRLASNVKGNVSTLGKTTASSTRNLVNDSRGAISANGGLSAEISSSSSAQQGASSKLQSSIAEGADQGRSAVDAAVETAVDVAAEIQSEVDATLEEARSVSAEAAGDLELTGSGGLGL